MKPIARNQSTWVTAPYLPQDQARPEASRGTALAVHDTVEPPPRREELFFAMPARTVPAALMGGDDKIILPEDPRVVQQRRAKEEAAQYDHYKEMIERNGGEVDETPNRRHMLAIRQDTSGHANGGKNQYDDTAVLLWTDEYGAKHCRTYQCCTEPGEAMLDEGWGESIGGDDRKDLGRLPPGNYEYSAQWSLGRLFSGGGHYLGMPDGTEVDAEYDVDHDGYYGENVRGVDGEEILWHPGRDNDPRSAGCNSMPPDEWDRFWQDMGDPEEGTPVKFTLVAEAPERGDQPYQPPPTGSDGSLFV